MADLNNNVFTLNKYVEFVLDGLVGQAGWSHGWFGGGNSPATVSTIDRVIFSTDTAIALSRGKLSTNRVKLSSTGNNSDSWFGGGYNSVPVSIVDRVIFSTDTSTATVKGNLSTVRNYGEATGTLTDGWYGAGNNGPAYLSNFDRVIFASDTATAVIKGAQPRAQQHQAAITDFSTSGWWCNGWNPGVFPASASWTTRVIFASDTATSIDKGNIHATIGAGGASNTTDGWIAGANVAPGGGGAITTVSRIIFSTDTAAAVVKGPRSVARSYIASVESVNDGWFGGGTVPGYHSDIDRIIFANDTNTAVAKGPLSVGRYELGAF